MVSYLLLLLFIDDRVALVKFCSELILVCPENPFERESMPCNPAAAAKLLFDGD